LKFGENLVIKKLLAMLSCLFDDARTEFFNGCNRFATGAIPAGLLACRESIEEVAFFLT
jgi:hypothetical protein